MKTTSFLFAGLSLFLAGGIITAAIFFGAAYQKNRFKTLESEWVQAGSAKRLAEGRSLIDIEVHSFVSRSSEDLASYARTLFPGQGYGVDIRFPCSLSDLRRLKSPAPTLLVLNEVDLTCDLLGALSQQDRLALLELRDCRWVCSMPIPASQPPSATVRELRLVGMSLSEEEAERLAAVVGPAVNSLDLIQVEWPSGLNAIVARFPSVERLKVASPATKDDLVSVLRPLSLRQLIVFSPRETLSIADIDELEQQFPSVQIEDMTDRPYRPSSGK